MNFKHPALRKAPAVLGLLAVLLWLPGCPLSPDSDDGGPTEPTIAPERTTVQGAVDLFEFVWQNKRVDLYEQLLHANFEYLPQTADLADFPWLQTEPWNRAEEIGIATNMFDPSFVGDEAESSIDTIQMVVRVLDQRNVLDPPNGVEITTNMEATVLWAANTGKTSDVRLIFVLVPDPANASLWQIYQQREEPLI